MENLWSKVKLWQMLAIVASAILLCVAYYFGWIGPPGIIDFILSVIAASVIGAYFATREKEPAEKQKEHDAKVTKQQEYNAAVDYLSSPNPAIRLRGVQALYQHANINTQDIPAKKEIWDLLNNHVRYYTQDINYQKNFYKKPSADVQEIIDIQGCREGYKESNVFLSIKSKARVEWAGAWLRGANLAEAHLQGAILNVVQLQGAHLVEAQLQETVLAGAQLQKATLNGVQLHRAILAGAQLQGAHLVKVQLQGAFLALAQLQGANLTEAQLQGATLSGAKLQSALLTKAQLQGANLADAQLQGAVLHKVQLQGAVLHKVQLQGATLHRVRFQGAHEEIESQFTWFEWSLEYLFKNNLTNRIEKDTELDNVVLKGGLTEDDIKRIEIGMNLDVKYRSKHDKGRRELVKVLDDLFENHCGEKISGSNEEGERMLEEQNVALGSYSKEDAEQWIEEFDEAIG